MDWEDCVDLILANMVDLERVDHTREFPTPYHYLLYDIFATMVRLIEDSARIDQGLQSAQIDRIDMTHDTISKSAVITMGRCLRSVLESPNVTVEFKAYTLHMVLRRCEDALERDDLRELYEMAVTQGTSSTVVTFRTNRRLSVASGCARDGPSATQCHMKRGVAGQPRTLKRAACGHQCRSIIGPASHAPDLW